jgi:hypothetical protein
MVVKELIELLEKLDQDKKVFIFDNNYCVFEEVENVLLNGVDEKGFKIHGLTCDGYLIYG